MPGRFISEGIKTLATSVWTSQRVKTIPDAYSSPMTGPTLGFALIAVVDPGDNPPDWCFESNEQGEMPSCMYADGEWTQVFEGSSIDGSIDGPFDGPSAAIPGAFAFFFVLVAFAAIAMTVWRVSTARRMARDSGMSESDATAMTLLSDDGFEATYLASNLRQPPPAPATPPVAPEPPRASADRLRELQGLLDDGLITSDEYAARRSAILDGL